MPASCCVWNCTKKHGDASDVRNFLRFHPMPSSKSSKKMYNAWIEKSKRRKEDVTPQMVVCCKVREIVFGVREVRCRFFVRESAHLPTMTNSEVSRRNCSVIKHYNLCALRIALSSMDLSSYSLSSSQSQQYNSLSHIKNSPPPS